MPGALLFAIVAVAVAAAAWGFARARNEGAAAHLDAFRAGAAIYGMTYFLPVTSWDYKLVFAILMIPQILEWASVRPQGGLAKTALAAFLATLWLSREHHVYLAGEVLNLALLAYSLHMLLRTRPSWLGWTSGRTWAGVVRS